MMMERYWVVTPNGGRQLIDPSQFDLSRLSEDVRRFGGRLVVERLPVPASVAAAGFQPPVSALGAMFRTRFERIFQCRVAFELDLNTRPTHRVLGGYYKRRRLVRVYSHDRTTGRRSVEELWDTFLHELAHHIEYTEPQTYHADACQRVRGQMHSPLFWRILGDLKRRWAECVRAEQART
jgi:hypothetical protein